MTQPNKPVRVSNAKLQQMIETMTQAEVAKHLGINQSTVQRRASKLGISAPRQRFTQKVKAEQYDQFRELWNAGVLSEGIARYFDISMISVGSYARRLNLPKRVNRHGLISLADYTSRKLAKKMADDAKKMRKINK